MEESFKEKGPTGSTLRKSIVFYLQAAKYCGISVSPHFQVRGYLSKTGRPSAKQATRQGSGGEELPKPVTLKPETHGASAESLKIKYIEMLMKKADEKDDPALLDRIEKLLGQTEGGS